MLNGKHNYENTQLTHFEPILEQNHTRFGSLYLTLATKILGNLIVFLEDFFNSRSLSLFVFVVDQCFVSDIFNKR